MLVSMNQLQEFTGKTYRTIKKYIDGVEPAGTGRTKANLWESTAVLPLIYAGGPSAAPGALDASQEKAKLDKERRKTQELKNAELEKRLIDAEQVKRVWVNHIVSAKTKILGVQAKLTPIMRECNTECPLLKDLDFYHREILEDLAESDPVTETEQTDDE